MSWTLFIVYLGVAMPPLPHPVSSYSTETACEAVAKKFNASISNAAPLKSISQPFAVCMQR